MGITKRDLFNENQNDLATAAKALGHPARIAILQYLIEKDTCINTSLVQELGLAQATISQHLTALKSLDIIQGSIEGSSMSYCINPKKWNELKKLFNLLFNQYVDCSEGDCC